MDKYEERYHAKRAAGISPIRKDGSRCDPEVDRQAGHAEEFAAKELGAVVDDSVTETGDRGYDFKITLQLPTGEKVAPGVEAIWNGFESGSKTMPRMNGNLLVNPYEPHRYRNSNIFVLVGGTINHGFQFLGWATKKDVEKRDSVNFGYGDRYRIPVKELRSIELLKRMMVNDG